MKPLLKLSISCIFLLVVLNSSAQKNPAAKIIFDKAIKDSVDRKYGDAAEAFMLAAREELKTANYDPGFAGNCFHRGALHYYYVKKYQESNDAYYLALDQYRLAKQDPNIFLVLKEVANMYTLTSVQNVVYKFPVKKNMETILATRTIESLKLLPDRTYEATIDGGSSDGLYEGSDAEVFGAGGERSNKLLGHAKIIEVYPNSSKAIIKSLNPSDTTYRVFRLDMISVPIRYPQQAFKDVFLEVSLLNIKFVDNSRQPLAHPRTLMYYASPQLEAEVYRNMLSTVKEQYEMIKDDTTFNPKEKIKRGRLKGYTWKEAMNKSTAGDLKAFLGFVRTYPSKYMGGTWKISETYATWLLNNTPWGVGELMDSLLALKTDAQIQSYIKLYNDDIKSFFINWLVDAQNLGLSGKLDEAFRINDVLLKIGTIYNDPDKIGWTYFNVGRINDEIRKYDESIEAYKKGISYFEKGLDQKGLSFCLNNLARIYDSKYRFKESLPLYDKVVKVRLETYKTDTSDDQKVLIARAYWATGDSYYDQFKNKEAIEQYNKGLSFVSKLTTLDARKVTATLNRSIGKSYSRMGEYLPASEYYQLEYTFQKALGDVEAQADALDNVAYVLSKVGKYRESFNTYSLAYEHHVRSGEKSDAALSMSNIGQVLWSLGKFDSAIDAHNKSIAIRRDMNDAKGEAGSWKKIAGLYKESGDAVKSMEAYQHALDIYKKLDAKLDYGELLEDIASNYSKIKDYVNARKYYEDAIDIYRNIKSRDKEADVLNALGNMFYDDQKYAEADEYYIQAGSIQKEINDKSGLMYTHINRGSVAQYLREDYKDAIKKMSAAFALAVETNSESNIAFCENKLGMLYSYINEYDSALAYYNKSMIAYRKLEDKEKQSQLYVNYGYYYNYRGDFEKAKQNFEQALTIGKEISNAYSIASATYGLVTYYYNNGDFPEALKSIDEVLRIYKEKENPWGIASVYLDQGNIRNNQGEFDEALGYYYKTDSLYKKLALEKPRISVTNNIGTIYYQQKNFDGAMKQFEQTKKMLDKYNDDPAFQALIKSNIGEVYVDQKKNTEAEKWLLESLQMARQQKNSRQLTISHMIYGRLLSNMKNYELAEKNFKTADSIITAGGEKTHQIQLLESWGKMLFNNSKYDLAESKLLECIKLSNQTQYNYYTWKAYSTLADLQFATNKTDAGLNYLKSAVQEVERIKSKITGADAKKIFSSDESIVELYQKMVVYLKKQGRVEEALVYMEKANAENVKLRLNSGDVTYNDVATNEAVAKEKDLRKQQAIIDNQIAKEKAKPEQLQHKEQIAQWEKMRSVTAEQYKAYVTELKVKYPNLQAFKTVDPTEFMAQRRKIPNDVAVVSYLVTDKEMSVFVVMKDTIFIKDIPLDRELLQKKIKNFYTLHAGSSRSVRDARGGKITPTNPTEPIKEDKKELAADLYEVLVAPLMADIQSKQRIAIVPSGFLCFVPFDALISKQSDGSIKYFGEQKQLFYVNKISTVTSGDNEPLSDFKVVAVGNADKSLPNAEDEVKELKEQLPKTVVYLREQATKKNVLGNKGDFNILHLATHGILDYSNADSSYLVLASDPASNDDGRLTIAQIQQMTDIDRFRMVTLSACQTAVIREVAEGWPISTASAFIEMGVPTVIATLWQVDDKATRLLINKFYENLKSMDKLSALQKAQIYLKNQPGYEDPYYWAPFQLVGLWK